MSRYRVYVRYNLIGSGGGTTRNELVTASSEYDAERRAIDKVRQSMGSRKNDYEYAVTKVQEL